ncbi:hypothetical protein [Gymnodinialimonas ceratoperidinii]|uniref:DUF1127 domain-containing protein n=1 Tax=Gymnodinialimonas ceratoperidinii TaxID=2856823 RepID=A0A8F6U0L0_9RHOB|nr:hypothetical protein [Gymnodinialimonas ceratoperidinii]QXT41161.1 hypothetical protein KYE46_08120 [Gymnodinialimonas ceratoperidinii]
MTRNFVVTHTEFRNPMPALLRRIARQLRMRKEIETLKNLPSDRLQDLGISPRTAANRRNSGETGKLPPTLLW